MAAVRVRHFEKRDAAQLLQLMKGLAIFEGYIDDFVVTESDLIKYGLCDKPAFEAYVADDGVQLLGWWCFTWFPGPMTCAPLSS